MSPASKKSKEKKAGKESQKASTKASGPAGAGPASAYNPILGTFHALELSSATSASSVQSNGRFRNIDDSDDHSASSLAAGVEYDSVSNNGSWSGESEDHKDKPSSNLPGPARQETIPGADNEKREKIRQKNEKKHQRQKERRALELHERCTGYLMSRKLETLAQQLVAMGFPQERATMALILNEGKVEESVAWLFEGAEEADRFRDQTQGGSNLKIDISDELARIADLETRHSCSKQEVERAVVANEGDLEKAAETLRSLKLDPPATVPKAEETGDPPTLVNGKVINAAHPTMRAQVKSNPVTIQQRRDERDFNYTKQTVTVSGLTELANKNLLNQKRVQLQQQKMEWPKPPQAAGAPSDERWPNTGSSPSASYSLVSPLQVSSSPAKSEPRYSTAGTEVKILQPGALREPIIMMQRPQSLNPKQPPPQVQTTMSMSSPLNGSAAGWFPEIPRSSGFIPQIPNNNLNSNQMYQHQFHYQPQHHLQAPPLFSGSGLGDSSGTGRGNNSNLWSRGGVSPTLAAASSLGLFSGVGSAGSSGASSPVDWSTAGSMMHTDYTSIDWSLDRALPPTRPNGLLWNNGYEPRASGLGAAPPRIMRAASSGVSGGSVADDGTAGSETGGGRSREWSSPFEGEDLFSLPRQFVSSPTL